MGTLASAQLERGVIQQQLEKILASSQFAETTRLDRFLKYLVNESLAGHGEALKGYAIGLDVFDKPEDFDPSIDTIVRVQAGKLRNRLDLYYASEGKDDPVRIIVPKGSYAPVFEVAFDPESVDKGPDDGDGITTEKSRNALEKYSIAVLPFDNLSGDPGQEYLADGITEEILNALARFRELRVISRHSTFRYKDKPGDPREIGNELGVRYVLEGSFRRWQDQVRVTAQLIETTSGAHLTSEVYDKDISAQNLFDIQEDIAARIAAEIAEPHGVIHRIGSRRREAGTTILDAYECRLLASEYWREPNIDSHKRVRGLLERAVSVDPRYAGAWAMLAIVYGDEVRGGYNFQPDPPPLDRALEAARKAVEIDPVNATGYHALFITHFHRGELASYRKAADRALALNANYPDLVADYGICLGLSGNWDDGYKHVQRAIDLSPHPPGWYWAFMAIYFYVKRDYSKAREQTESVRMSAFFWGDLISAMIFGQLGDHKSAKAAAASALAAAPDFEDSAKAALTLWNFQPDDIQHMVEGWRKAGLEVKL